VRPGRRLDIQGLRAVAVLMVVAYHAGLPVPGGFVGVDVFFVISGFVIAGMIDREWSSTGRFGFGRFYLRRFKRLTPALALMVAVTMILACCLLSPFGPQQWTAQTGIGAMLLVANFVIAQTTGGYFDPPAESNALLNTWSLSVEEQFYLVFPAILLLGWVLSRRGRRRVPWGPVLVGAVALVSLGLAMLAVNGLAPPHSEHLLGFYSPLTRAWEFAVGALLALTATSRSLRSDRHATVLAWLGAALLAGSAGLVTKALPFPFTSTALAVGGTLLVIAAGTHHTTRVSRALALPGIVRVGDWSYSIYLWHWPLKVFAVYLWPDAPYAAVLAATLSILPAVASYRWVEQPLRRLPPLSRPRTAAFVGAVVLPPILLAASLGIAANEYWLPRYLSGAAVSHRGDIDWNDFFRYLGETYYPCSDQAIRDNTDKWVNVTRCRQSKPGSHIDIALVGDSYVEHLFTGLAEDLPDKNIVYYFVDGLPVKSTKGMGRIIDHVVSDPAIKTVIISAAWAVRGVPSEAGDELVKTFEAFTSGHKAVFVTDGVPYFQFDAVACKFRRAPILPFTKCSENRGRFEAAYAKQYPELKAAVDKVPGVQLLNTVKYFCDNGVCSMNRGEDLLYRDNGHVNNVGSRFLADRTLADFPQFRAALTQS
jgi:peptidoglycan/LPS O-acetylase OafA/YrhL